MPAGDVLGLPDAALGKWLGYGACEGAHHPGPGHPKACPMQPNAVLCLLEALLGPCPVNVFNDLGHVVAWLVAA